MFALNSNIPLQRIEDSITLANGVNLYFLRIDLSHPVISGNKFYKLKYNLQEAKKIGNDTVLTFGGAYSNHIAATAAAGKEYGFKTIGIIRGEENKELNPTLKLAIENGMELHYVSRTLFQNKLQLYNWAQEKFDSKSTYLIPEGGFNELGIKGCQEIAQNVTIDYDYITVACGTGGTMTGIVRSLKPNQQAIGFQVLKSQNYIKNEIEKYIPSEFNNCWSINENYHFGGYAKINKDLLNFMEWFEKQHTIPLDFIYTGKMMYGVYDLIKKEYFLPGSTIIAIHTGGLQGNKGFST